jgi:hypothetical protein
MILLVLEIINEIIDKIKTMMSEFIMMIFRRQFIISTEFSLNAEKALSDFLVVLLKSRILSTTSMDHTCNGFKSLSSKNADRIWFHILV